MTTGGTVKQRPEEFGGGRPAGRPPYSATGIKRLMCSRAGCSREAYATWGACADENVQRPLCPECDVALNRIALEWFGDPDARRKLEDYQIEVEKRIGRGLYGQPPLWRPPIDWNQQLELSIAGAPS